MVHRYCLRSHRFCFGAAIAVGVASFFVEMNWSIVFGQYLLLLCGFWLLREERRNREIERKRGAG